MISEKERGRVGEMEGQDIQQYDPPPQHTMSATTLLQKAAQMGASDSDASLVWGYGLERDDTYGASIALGIEVGYDGRTGFEQLRIGTPSVYGPKHTLGNFLGLGMAGGGGTTNGLSALMTSIGGSVDVTKVVSSFGLVVEAGEFTGKDMGEIVFVAVICSSKSDNTSKYKAIHICHSCARNVILQIYGCIWSFAEFQKEEIQCFHDGRWLNCICWNDRWYISTAYIHDIQYYKFQFSMATNKKTKKTPMMHGHPMSLECRSSDGNISDHTAKSDVELFQKEGVSNKKSSRQ